MNNIKILQIQYTFFLLKLPVSFKFILSTKVCSKIYRPYSNYSLKLYFIIDISRYIIIYNLPDW